MDSNVYTTAMTGLKYKIAHKRADKETWSASDHAQRKRLIQILKEMIDKLEQDAYQDVGTNSKKNGIAK